MGLDEIKPVARSVEEGKVIERRDEFVVVVAPDKFKGSLDAAEVASVVADEIARCAPDVRVVRSPIADGGEGTVAVAVRAGFSPAEAPVRGPLGAPITAPYATRGDDAVVEMAAAAGLQLLPSGPTPQTALLASTYGVGQLIRHAIDRGARRVFVGAGGSATTDGGRGALQALGLVRADGTLAATTTDQARSALGDAELIIACDVDNPLLGANGAAAVYGPQKGADPEMVRRLEGRLGAWAEQVVAATGRDLRAAPGVGAAGGFAFGLAAVAGARIVPGVQVAAELSHLTEQMAQADLVIVGEGSLDEQSLRGKGPIGVAGQAPTGTHVVAVAGRNRLTQAQQRQANLSAVYALLDIEPNPVVCMRDARTLLSEAVHRLVRDWITPSTKPRRIPAPAVLERAVRPE